MLFYSRLKGTQKDYLFEFINLHTCIKEVLEDYMPLLEEKRFQIKMQVPEIFVYSDRRGLTFLISQVISNSVKYTGANIPELCIKAVKTDRNYVCLSVIMELEYAVLTCRISLKKVYRQFRRREKKSDRYGAVSCKRNCKGPQYTFEC